MPVPWLLPGEDFPPTSTALDEPNGLLAAGADLSPPTLLKAYQLGIFPWFEDGQPVLWWTPDPRMVLNPGEVHISKSLKKSIRRQEFTISFDNAFSSVIQACAGFRPNSSGTWITKEMQEAYTLLHEQGYAHSVEVWKSGKLCGGLYGIAIDQVFFGESMFSHETDASKYALAILCRHFTNWDINLVDCQVANEHLFSLGAREIPRHQFEYQLGLYCRQCKPVEWRLDPEISL